MIIDPGEPVVLVWERGAQHQDLWVDHCRTLQEAAEHCHAAASYDIEADPVLVEVTDPDGTRRTYTPDEVRDVYPPAPPDPPPGPRWYVVLDPPPEIHPLAVHWRRQPEYEIMTGHDTEAEAVDALKAWSRFGDRARVLAPDVT